MTEINNCENCHHYNSLIHWDEGLFHQCMMGNKLWEKCNDYDAIKELERMTEKRYKSIGANLECPNGMEYMLIKRNDGFNVCQVCSKYTAKEIVDELNSLADENEQLKIRFNEEREKSLKFCRNIDTLTIENEQLKSEIEKLSYANEDLLSEKRNWQRMSDEYCKLSDENEYIKNTIKEAYETERTHIGKSVLKQLLNNIKAIQ